MDTRSNANNVLSDPYGSTIDHESPNKRALTITGTNQTNIISDNSREKKLSKIDKTKRGYSQNT